MVSILTLKRRIQAAQNVSKTTKAMQMIAASKLRRAQETTLASRPYVAGLSEMAKNVAHKKTAEVLHPYLERSSKASKKLLVVISPDKGLCGGLITALARACIDELSKGSYQIITVGKKADQFTVHLGKEIIASFPIGNTLPSFSMTLPIIKIIDEAYRNKKVDEVKILTTKFESIFSQKPFLTTILPLTKGFEEDLSKDIIKNDQLFEPSVSELLPFLLKRYLEMTLYQYILESYLSEQAARMIAMQNATNNANDIIIDLRLEYNKTRQEKITSEILDITVGTAVLYG